ncbi:phosphodiester glycosidase family protein [Galbibacter sp. BG1]|uniref:phosphodiester glycosidase family protein n=1 Tax=Galbibacter sp. BG1 TaxID=1170699 RepID=UPI0015BADB52|nr:phosphodiester glycosidase family protein [Galbibacter sp. BG1]QLE01559.1 phosphodiester glycosidase family protein [Galbibacter sp. BG1]
MKKTVLITALLITFFFNSDALFAQENLVWELKHELRDELPSSIKIYETFSALKDGSPLHAIYAEVDISNPNIVLSTEYVGAGKPYKTPLQFAEEQQAKDYVIVNGGYFSDTQSVSLIVRDGKLVTPGVPIVSGKYPTRGAFGISKAGKPHITWTYNFEGDTITYSFSKPNTNLNKMPVRDSKGVKTWKMTYAIGAGPVLVENGKPRVFAEEEHIHTSTFKERAPRTAVGYTLDDKVILIVIDGRQKGFSEGVSLPELASIMVDLGCIKALNLDGGGSSAMVVAGALISCPSEEGGMQRPVPSVFMVKQKQE